MIIIYWISFTYRLKNDDVAGGVNLRAIVGIFDSRVVRPCEYRR